MYAMLRKRLVGCLLAGLVGCSSCGNNNDENNVIIEKNNTNNSNNETNNETTTNNNNNTNNLTTARENCEMVEQFRDESVDVEREFYESTNVHALSCRQDIGEVATDGAYVVELIYTEQTRVTIGVTPIAGDAGTPPRPAVEIRRAGCETGEAVACDSAPTFEQELDANTPYYLIINGLLRSGGVGLTIDATPIGCTAGEASCADGVETVCLPNGTPRETVCPGDCSGDVCGGNVCEMPVVVAPQADGPAIVVEGNRRSFSADWEATGACELQNGDPAPDTSGPEFFLLVESVSAGQTVLLDADESTSSYGFYVLEDCNATGCVDGFVFDEVGANRGEYVATEDGDVLVAVEAQGDDRDRAFVMEVSITQ